MIIKNIQLENFKCFRKVDIEFGKITLLTGANSSGKSSFIDAVLAIMQSNDFPKNLTINGKYKNLGGFKDIVFQNTSNFFEIEINFTEKESIKTTWQEAEKFALPELKKITGKNHKFINIFDEKFNFIDSFRAEPKFQYFQSSAQKKILTNGNGFPQQIADWEENNPRKLGELTNYLRKLKLVHSIKTEKRDDGTFKILKSA